MAKFTQLQERFIAEVMRNGWNGTQAYETASNGKANLETCARESHKLLNLPKIAQEITKRSTRLEEKTTVDLAWITTRLVNVHHKAYDNGDLSTARASLMDIAKLRGYGNEKRELEVTHRSEAMLTLSSSELRELVNASDEPETLAIETGYVEVDPLSS